MGLWNIGIKSFWLQDSAFHVYFTQQTLSHHQGITMDYPYQLFYLSV